jgi:intracellular sulfur oxidation DsrE/DsrF family protein
MSNITLAGLLLGAAMTMSGTSQAATLIPIFPIIPQFGGIFPMPTANERPDPKLRYRVIFNITKSAVSPDKLNPSLEKVARLVNLLGADGVRPAVGDIVAIVQGPATPLILQNAAYAARTKEEKNPNLALITALKKAGVSVRVCSQAMIGNDITADQVAADVIIDDSALTTLTNLQLRGYALIPD